jgi:hypothetical protein
MLTAPEFQQLAEVPPAAEWLANLDNSETRRAYRNDLQEFMGFVGISGVEYSSAPRRATPTRPRERRRGAQHSPASWEPMNC